MFAGATRMPNNKQIRRTQCQRDRSIFGSGRGVNSFLCDHVINSHNELVADVIRAALERNETASTLRNLYQQYVHYSDKKIELH